ncbi:hypothetical protein MTIM_32110 [Mycobacterium timonense]|uniref:Uncharacterized protein n=1 Tax=Mycobacterium timonense TaxID=701043 RepID=A0A7I9Z913_9MYCO|nr:hypothetical protein MTIM_32110 [Mycobacterium timonense]
MRQAIRRQIDLAIGPGAWAAAQCDGVGCAKRLRGEQFRNASPARRAGEHRPIAELVETLALARREHIDRGQSPGRVGDHRQQDALDPVGKRRNGSRVEEIGVVFDAQRELAARRGLQRQWVVGGFVTAEVGDGQLTELHRGRRVQRVVLEDEQGVEQLVVTGDAVNLGQRQVLVIQGLLKVVVQLAQQAGDGGLRGHVRAHRHGVDQQAHHRFDAGHVGRASRDRGPEDHVALPGQRHQQLRPRGPQHGVDGGVVGPRQVVQRLSGLLGEPARFQAVAPQPLPVRRSHQGGSVEAGQHFSPAGMGGVEVPAGLPGHEPPVRHRRGQVLRVVGGEDFLQQDRQG